MPIYEYLCDACGYDDEVFQKISENPLKKCPSCGSAKFKKLISQTSFHLKGGGWYADGYASKKPETAEKKSVPAEKKEAKTETKKPEKPAKVTPKASS